MTQSKEPRTSNSPSRKPSLKLAIAVIVVVVIVVLGATIYVVTRPQQPSTTTLSASASSLTVSVNQTLTFSATVTGGTPSQVTFNFGDGTTFAGVQSSGNYTASHSYLSPGIYLVTVNATVKGSVIDNLDNIIQVTVNPQTLPPSVASESTQAAILTSTQLYTVGSTVELTGASFESPGAANWTIGYFMWDFGNGVSHTDYAIQNTSNGQFLSDNVTSIYNTSGVYPLSLGIITFNSSGYTPITYNSTGSTFSYYPLSDLSTILASPTNYLNNTYFRTIVVGKAGQTLKIANASSSTSLKTLTEVEVAPGGPSTFDPPIAVDVYSLEALQNVYEPLVEYNGSSNTIVPVVASQVPTVANGLESPNGLTYTFHIRQGQKFSNGDPVTAWDVYTSIIRDLLFTQGVPYTEGYLLAADLLPGGGYAQGALSYQNITNAITVNNNTQIVTFHLLIPDLTFLQRFASLWGVQIMDYNWLVSHGQNITFTPAGFEYYQQFGNQANYNDYVRYHMMGSGPYMVGSYILGQSILYVPNPNFVPIPGIAQFNKTPNENVQVYYLSSSETALLMLKNGQANIVTGLPSADFPTLLSMKNQGKITMHSFPSSEVWYYVYNFNINETTLRTFGSQYSVPYNYFANPYVRLAFSYAYNYTNYLENILGNSLYSINFGTPISGAIPYGMPGYQSASQLKNVPYYNLSLASQYMNESGNYSTKVNIPIIVWSGDTTDYTGASMWAQALHQMDPNIQATPLYVPLGTVIGYAAPAINPMPIYLIGWISPWNYPTAFFNFLNLNATNGGSFPPADGINYNDLVSWGYTSEAQQWRELNNLTVEATNSQNLTIAIGYYKQAEQLATNLSLYTFLYQTNMIYITTPNVKGMSLEFNVIANNGGQLFYNDLSLT